VSVLARTVHWQAGNGEGPQFAGHAWQELSISTQQPELQLLPAFDWQQWPEMQSLFFPQPAHPLAIPEAAIAAVGAMMLVISGVAPAIAAPAKPTLRTISRRDRPS
jgi:hypothetical protein